MRIAQLNVCLLTPECVFLVNMSEQSEHDLHSPDFIEAPLQENMPVRRNRDSTLQWRRHHLEKLVTIPLDVSARLTPEKPFIRYRRPNGVLMEKGIDSASLG